MHDALRKLDVLSYILDFIDNDSAVLAALSRTSQCFFAPAASRLWKDVDVGIRHLGTIITSLSDAADQARARARFSIYAASIRTLSLQFSPSQHSYWPSVDGYRCRTSATYKQCRTDFLQKLQQLPSILHSPVINVFLPSLRSITWLSAKDDDVGVLCGFLGPSLEVLEFRYGQELHEAREAMTMAVEHLVHDLLENSPSLQSFSLFFNSLNPDCLPALADLIDRLTDLTAFRTDFMPDAKLLTALSNHPNLNSIDLRPTTSPLAPSFSVSPIAQFCSVRTLRSTLAVPSTIRLIGPVSARLEHFAFRFQSSLTSDDLLTLMTYISYCTNLSFLAISISQRGPDRLAGVSWPVILRPVLRCSQIRTFTLDAETPIRIMMSESDMEDLAIAWPRLEVLNMDCVLAYDLTLVSIAALALHCPELRSVQIPVLRVDEISPFPDLTISPVQPSSSVNLRIANLKLLRDPDALLRFLVALWPVLQVEVTGIHSGPCQVFMKLLKDWGRREKKHKARDWIDEMYGGYWQAETDDDDWEEKMYGSHWRELGIRRETRRDRREEEEHCDCGCCSDLERQYYRDS